MVLSSIFFASSVVLGYFVYILTTRKAPLATLANSQMNEIFDTLINQDEKAAFSTGA